MTVHMQSSKKSICIVASTLPASFIASQASALKIQKIIVMSKNLELSYSVFRDRRHGIKVVCAPRGLPSQTLFFITQLLTAKLLGYRVVFFHECCLSLLDLLLMLIKPNGNYFPQVTMAGFNEIKFDEFPKQKSAYLIKLLGLVNRFRFYHSPEVGGSKPEYVISAKSYPLSIISKDVQYSRELISNSAEGKNITSNRILFITGKTFLADAVQIKLYLKLIDIAYLKGYTCHIKDHPNPIYRLNISSDRATSYDPVTPSELLEEDFHLVVGVSSTALLAYGERSISLIDMLPEVSYDDRVLCKNHFITSYPANKLKYIETQDEFEQLL